MSPVRPVFSDGAILGAADLTTLAQLGGDRDARHARHLHTPGIASGLELATEEKSDVGTYVEVTLQPGYAVDGNGRELVVATPLPVSHDRFAGDIPSPVKPKDSTITVWYPVFIHGLDAELASTNGPMGCQGGAGPTRIAEDVEVEFGRPGDASTEQPAPPPEAGPGDGTWQVLVGFVKFDTAIGRFVEVATVADGVTTPTAGARAGLVAGQRGRVEIRPTALAGPQVPAVVLDEQDGGSLVFGLHNGSGTVVPLMTVDASGNLVVTGTLQGVLTSGSVLVLSGSAFDGAVVPLPSGADPDAIESGALQLTVRVTPRIPEPASSPIAGGRFVVAECGVDDEQRVRCWGTWFDPVGPAVPVDASAACDYLVVVSAPMGGA